MVKKVLIIEHEKDVAELIQKRLANAGFDVVLDQDGRGGALKVKSISPDIILLDVAMPNKAGFEIMNDIQKDKELKNIPIIVISNSGQQYEVEQAKSLGAKNLVLKTEFDPQDIVNKVINQIGK